ncbi:hypothetical protein LTR74_015486 [Friedmanniomyces endolithicus]|nr:hypothetical protein LTR74_015486 [Friedmanniomyces endolithicus]
MSGSAHLPGFHSFGAPRGMPPGYQQLPPAQPRLLYFISRDTGIMVPLIPADELPFNVRLAGVPRVLRMEDMLGMHHVGMVAYTGMTYALERDIHTGVKMLEDPAAAMQAMQRSMSQPPPVDPTRSHLRSQSGTPITYLAPDAHARHALAHSAAYNSAAYASNSARPVSAHETATTWRSSFNPTSTPVRILSTRALPTTTTTPSTATPPANNPPDPTQSIIDAILATTSGAQEASRLNYIPKSALPTPPSGTLPDAEKKEFCTHWIRTGECDYTQQGCMYKHEMPEKATLERIGFRGLPRWWTERIGGGAFRGRGGGVSGNAGSVGTVGSVEGGRLATVGEVVKSSVWLKRGGKEEGSGSESESEGSVGGSAGRKSDEEREVVEVKQPAGLKPRLVPLKPLKMQGTVAHMRSPRVGTTFILKERLTTAAVVRTDIAAKRAKPKGSDHQDTVPVDAAGTTPNRATSPSAADLRKASTTSDLIDLAVPLLPTPSSSTPSLTPASSVNSSPRPNQPTPRTTSPPATPENLDIDESTTTTSKLSTKHVFVPKGESADHHIADALRKKQARQFARRGAPVSTVGGVMPLERQIGEMQRARTGGRKYDEIKVRAEGRETVVGLMGSRHAPGAGKVVGGVGRDVRMGVVKERKGVVGLGGMRIRRPAGFGGVEGSAKGLKKEGERDAGGR